MPYKRSEVKGRNLKKKKIKIQEKRTNTKNKEHPTYE